MIEGSHLLVATGRTPNTDGIGLEVAGVERDGRGYVKVDEHLRTTMAGVWAVGDCAGSPQFTHIGLDDFRVVRDNLAGGQRATTGRQVPSCLFTDPELARVGLSEREAKERGTPYRLAKVPMAAVLRAQTLSQTRGFMKALVEVGSDRILGLTAFGAGTGEVGQRCGEVREGLAMPQVSLGLDLEDEHVARPPLLDHFVYLPLTGRRVLDLVQQDDIVAPRHLCNNLLHKRLIRVGFPNPTPADRRGSAGCFSMSRPRVGSELSPRLSPSGGA